MRLLRQTSPQAVMRVVVEREAAAEVGMGTSADINDRVDSSAQDWNDQSSLRHYPANACTDLPGLLAQCSGLTPYGLRQAA